ncbi:hypothetical protein X801_04388 [Opisthorchis viverrini]|uniref:Uncharacterized protein n=1 Tax=Opisthorchis viverrini TaxID=6198 RepID=A0A1S8WZ41_OPIVI|nr:hypothetical protein X801_04388 [Opisthorchis viverrini]
MIGPAIGLANQKTNKRKLKTQTSIQQGPARRPELYSFNKLPLRPWNTKWVYRACYLLVSASLDKAAYLFLVRKPEAARNADSGGPLSRHRGFQR